MSSVIWSIFCWNIRGLNSDDKCLALQNKIDESGCSIVCLQETKKMDFDHSFVCKCCPRRFDKYEFMPSIRASRGLAIFRCSSFFQGTVIHKEDFVLMMKFSSAHVNTVWYLSNIYGPCTGPRREDFVNWFMSLQVGFMIFGFSWVISTSCVHWIIAICQVATSMMLCSSTKSLVIFPSWNYPSKDASTHGQTCKSNRCLNNLIGSFHQLNGRRFF